MVFSPSVPSLAGLPMAIMPETSVVKISGTMSMRIRLMKAVPTGWTQVAIHRVAASCPMTWATVSPKATPAARAINTRCQSLIPNHQPMIYPPRRKPVAASVSP